MTIPPDKLRVGAALLRCLVAGDLSAAPALHDWFLENGMPSSTGVVDLSRKYTPRDCLWWLLNKANYGVKVELIQHKWGVFYSCFGSMIHHSDRVWLGAWPAEVWESVTPVKE